MSLTLLQKRVGIECNRCHFERWWPRETNLVTLADIQAKAQSWGWTFNGSDLCDECSKPKGAPR